jgi:hypothetical protein
LLAAILISTRPALFALDTNSPRHDKIPDLRPPHAELAPTLWEQHGNEIVLGAVAAVLVLGAGVWFLLRPKPPVLIPPDVTAREALAPLAQQPENGAVLSAVSQILRRYTAAAFEMPPGELTTTEFSRAIASNERIGPALSAALADFLRQCDERKFSPAPHETRLGAVSRAEQLITEAESRLAKLRAEAANAPAAASSPTA